MKLELATHYNGNTMILTNVNEEATVSVILTGKKAESYRKDIDTINNEYHSLHGSQVVLKREHEKIVRKYFYSILDTIELSPIKGGEEVLLTS